MKARGAGKIGVATLNRFGVGVVLTAGGLRGAVHVGVLRQLVRHGIPIDVLVGVSAGAVVAGYYAAVGLDFDELLADAFVFRGRHLLMHSLNVRLDYRFDRWLAPVSGVIPGRLHQLEAASFDRLKHGVHSLGIVCHDLMTGQHEILARIHRWWSPSKVEVHAHAPHDRPHECPPQPP